jgi:hypothetical protein
MSVELTIQEWLAESLRDDGYRVMGAPYSDRPWHRDYEEVE